MPLPQSDSHKKLFLSTYSISTPYFLISSLSVGLVIVMGVAFCVRRFKA
ncbi:MAG: hypothetical protein IPP48_02445 [Chitinophagaceae bacterium]|nr:hypothetical protein [Chitinophagaceae bacterium]